MLENSIFSSFATKTVVSYAAGFVWKMIDDGKTVPSEHTFDPLVAVRIAESNDCRVQQASTLLPFLLIRNNSRKLAALLLSKVRLH